MPGWEIFHGWMAFRYLDANQGLTRSFTIAYKMTDDGAEHWTNRFNRFKSKKDRGALMGGVTMMEVAVPQLVTGLGLDPSRTTFVPALSSSETVAAKKGLLAVLARRCAKAAGAASVHDAISKRPHQPIHGIYNAAARKAVLDGAEYRAGDIDADDILVFDDFITRGDTLSHIAQAILEANPRARMYGVALGKAERRAYHRQFGREISNDHVPKKWDILWRKGEG